MPLTESLTVEISADSGPLESELARVAERVAALSDTLRGVSGGAAAAGAAVSAVGEAVGPLSNLSSLIGRVTSQLRGIGRIPVTVNTAPATASVAALSRQIAAVAAQLAALNRRGGGVAGGLPGGSHSGDGPTGGGRAGGVLASPSPGGGAAGGGPFRGPRFADGGLVSGPAGVDRVPALLTAGEFVLTADAVERLGRTNLERLNAGVLTQPPTDDRSSTLSNARAADNPRSTPEVGSLAPVRTSDVDGRPERRDVVTNINLFDAPLENLHRETGRPETPRPAPGLPEQRSPRVELVIPPSQAEPIDRPPSAGPMEATTLRPATSPDRPAPPLDDRPHLTRPNRSTPQADGPAPPPVMPPPASSPDTPVPVTERTQPAAPTPAAGPVFNEITVQVTQAIDLEELLRELQLGRTTALDRFA